MATETEVKIVLLDCRNMLNHLLITYAKEINQFDGKNTVARIEAADKILFPLG